MVDPAPDEHHDDDRPVLVMGASGKTGRAVAEALLARGVPVRAAVRPGREPAAPTGTTPVPVDLVTGQGLEAALGGVRAAYHLAPNVHPDEVGMARRLAAAALAADVPRLGFHSVLHPADARMPHHVRKAEAEAVLREALTARLVVLRPAAYHQNLLAQVLGGSVTVPYSADAPFTTVDLADVAGAAVRVLVDDRHDVAVHDLAGPDVLTTRQMAQLASEALGRPVDVLETTVEAWLDGPGARLPGSARRDLAAMFRAYDDGGLVGDAGPLGALLGRPPTPWVEAVHRAAATV